MSRVRLPVRGVVGVAGLPARCLGLAQHGPDALLGGR